VENKTQESREAERFGGNERDKKAVKKAKPAKKSSAKKK